MSQARLYLGHPRAQRRKVIKNYFFTLVLQDNVFQNREGESDGELSGSPRSSWESLTGLVEKMICKTIVTFDPSPKTIELRTNKIQRN